MRMDGVIFSKAKFLKSDLPKIKNLSFALMQNGIYDPNKKVNMTKRE